MLAIDWYSMQRKEKKLNSPIYLFDTFDRSKRLFVPLEQGKVKIYTCGPTVYDFPHIGNLRAYIFSDILRKMFEFNNYQVLHVINITDVGHLTSDADSGEDKMEVASHKQHQSAWDIAKFYTEVFKKNLGELNIAPPTIWSPATDHIQDQIDLIKKIEVAGYAYTTSDGVYFDTSKLDNYGYLARLDIDGMEPGYRVEFSGEKRNPTDFALWKLSGKQGERQMEWQSPWGLGFPGWHIECSAMAMKYLGKTIDVHTGGIDHIPVHHTNEIAQSESVTGQKFVNYWLHVAFLTVESQKMSKSAGTFITLQEVIDRHYDPLAFRYMALTSHYRAGLNFTWEGLKGAQKALASLREKMTQYPIEKVSVDAESVKEFRGRINNDLNTPQALAFLFEVVKSTLPDAVKRVTMLELDKVLGLKLDQVPTESQIPQDVADLLAQRQQFRREKSWSESDRVRQEIIAKGYDVEDTPQGPRIVKKGL